MQIQMARTYLFVPATKIELIDKAFAAGADAVILDWEDAVSTDMKQTARQNTAEYFKAQANSRNLDPRNINPPIWIRINDAQSEHFQEDVKCVSSISNIAGVFLPKTQSAGEIEHLHEQIKKPIAAIIETGLGILKLNEIAAAKGLALLTYGRLDLANDLGTMPQSAASEAIFDRLRCDLLINCAANGLPAPIESVFTDFKNPQGLEKYTARWRDMGFGAMLCIHPAQIKTIHETLKPATSEIEFAHRVVSEYESSGLAAFQIDGKMIDMPVIRRAQILLSQNKENK